MIQNIMTPDKVQAVYEKVGGRWYPVYKDLANAKWWKDRPYFDEFPTALESARPAWFPATATPKLLSQLSAANNQFVFADMVQDGVKLSDSRTGGASEWGGDTEDDVELRDQHHAADAAGESRDNRLGNTRDVPPQTHQAEADHDERGQNAERGGGRQSALARGEGDEGNGGAGGAADQHRVASEQGNHRGGEDRRKDPQHRRQAHQGGHGKTVGQRDQCCNHAARTIAK